MSTCTEKMGNEGFVPVSGSFGVVFKQDSVGVAGYKSGIFYIEYLTPTGKRLNLRAKIHVLGENKCGCGIALKKLVIYYYDPYKPLFEIVINFVLLQVLMEVFGALSL